ncbi:MAG: phospholipid/cholesterol/gamma-HCH transport system substrate-binding protein [Parasphingorhabdus sp.]|jgi:phospholipid/cholesterol/gamma-HCH transport system substrate-binding protein
MQNKMVETMVGAFVLAGIVALGFLALKVGNLGSMGADSTYRITANFDNIGGLNVKAPVTLAGVRIGRVVSIEVDKELFSAVVSMEMDSAFDNLPTDTSASILTAGLLGAQYVGLEPGGELEFLTDMSEIELTQSAVVLENLIGQFLFSQDKD